MAVFEADCPCCRATLLVDSDAHSVLSHVAAEPEGKATDLFQEVERVKAKEKTRDQRFAKQLDAQRRQGAALDQRFEGLLKKAKDSGPTDRRVRDIDLD